MDLDTVNVYREVQVSVMARFDLRQVLLYYSCHIGDVVRILR
jgi:hypothetical protein